MTGTDDTVAIITHDGQFHADDVFGVAMIREHFSRLGHAVQLFRTRDRTLIAEIQASCPGRTFLVDVGGQSDREFNFDHHQFSTISESGVRERGNGRQGSPLASAGLVWRTFGLRLVEGFTGCSDPTIVRTVADLVDRRLLEAIDAHDLGILHLQGYLQTDPTGSTRAHVTGLSQTIGMFNPPRSGTEQPSPQTYQLAFQRAAEFAGMLLRKSINSGFMEHQAQDELDLIYQKAVDKEILVLPRYMKWNRFVGQHPDIKYIVYPVKDGYQATVAEAGTSSKGRMTRAKFPAVWAGKRMLELSGITGVENAGFCHTDRHLAGAATLSAILRLVSASQHETWLQEQLERTASAAPARRDADN